jgi:hypothetical protein
VILAELFPWFPPASKAGDAIVIVAAIGILVAIAVVISRKRPKS